MTKNSLYFSLISFFGSSLIAATAQVKSDINAALTEDHWKFIEKNAPILIQPKCDPTEDWCVRIDFDDSDPTNNEKSSSTLTDKSPAAIDIDFIETGLAIEVVYQFNRPDSNHYGFDGESTSAWFKKNKLGSTFDEGVAAFDPKLVAVRTAAHGGMLTLAGSSDSVSVIGPDFGPSFNKGWIAGLSKAAVAQSGGNGRVVDLSLGRPVILSDIRNALVPLSSVSEIAKLYDAEDTVIFVPAASEGESREQVQKLFKNPRLKVIPYELRSEFMPKILKDKEGWLSKSYLIKPVERTTVDSRAVVAAIAGVGTEFRRNAKGDPCGANSWFGWPMIEIANEKGEALNLSINHYKDGLARGFYHFDTENAVVRNFVGFLTAKEIEEGGAKLVRNPAFTYSK